MLNFPDTSHSYSQMIFQMLLGAIMANLSYTNPIFYCLDYYTITKTGQVTVNYPSENGRFAYVTELFQKLAKIFYSVPWLYNFFIYYDQCNV